MAYIFLSLIYGETNVENDCSSGTYKFRKDSNFYYLQNSYLDDKHSDIFFLLFTGDPCSEPQFPAQCYGAQGKERAKRKLMMKRGSGLTSCSQGTKGHEIAAPQHLLIEENVEGLPDEPEGRGGLVLMRFYGKWGEMAG